MIGTHVCLLLFYHILLLEQVLVLNTLVFLVLGKKMLLNSPDRWRFLRAFKLCVSDLRGLRSFILLGLVLVLLELVILLFHLRNVFLDIEHLFDQFPFLDEL